MSPGGLRRPAPTLRADGRGDARRGAALIITMWVLTLLGLLVAAFSFDMRVEAEITSHYRKRTRASHLARAGVEWGLRVLELRRQADPGASNELDEDPVYMAAIRLQRGIGVQQARVDLDIGEAVVDILPEEQRRNVNSLNEDEWPEILAVANVPQDRWDELMDCFRDWTDTDDMHRLYGAERDDPHYRDLGYEPANAPVSTIEELLLIKGFDERILYGGPAEEDGDLPMLGIARWLTTWGDGRININAAGREVLLTLPALNEWEAEAIIENRAGLDGVWGTRDDGYTSVQEMLTLTGVNPALASRFTARDLRFVRIISTGEADGVRYAIWCTVQVEGTQASIVAWHEEPAY